MRKNLSIRDKKIIGGIAICIIVIIIAIVLSIDTNNNTNNNNSNNEIEVINSDVDKLSSIIESVNTSKIEIISNRNNEQADVILDSIGIDIKTITSYAGSIDPREESLHCILIVKPKEENYDIVKRSVTDYIAKKQNKFIGTEGNVEGTEAKIVETAEYKMAKEAILYEEDEYIVLVMAKNPINKLDKIRDGLAELREEATKDDIEEAIEENMSEDIEESVSSNDNNVDKKDESDKSSN